MSISIPLNKMSYEEKIQAMELLWDDLCQSPESIESPAWHQTLLSGREAALQANEDEFMDWDAAKKSIRNAIE